MKDCMHTLDSEPDDLKSREREAFFFKAVLNNLFGKITNIKK